MKRSIALFTVLVMLVTVFLPLNVFAENDKSLEEVIKIVKSKFEVPEKYAEFNYNINTEVNNRKVWYLNWNSKDGMDGGINVSIDDKGTILSYNNFKPYSGTKRNFPKISRSEAKVKAEEFIKKINPDILSNLRYNDNSQNALSEPVFYLNYTRLVNNVPFYNNSVNVEVNRETGEIQSYYSSWNDDLVFPAVDKVITVEEAQKAYKEKLGLRLVYLNNYDGKKINIFAAYVPKYDYNECIDALTGEKISLQPGYYGPYYGGGMADAKIAALKSSVASKSESANVMLTPDEQNAIEKVAKLITKDDAEKLAREFKQLGITSEYRLSNASLSKEWGMQDEFTWSLYFECAPSGDNKEYKSANIRINAANREIRGFYAGYPNNATEGKIDEATSKKAVEDFLKEFQPAKFSETEFDDTQKTFYPMGTDSKKPTQFNFRYIRKVNGVYFPGNALTVTYDAVNEKVLSYDMSWFNIAFPSVEKAVSTDSAYEKLFKDVGFELQYNAKYSNEYYLKFGPGNSALKPEVKLVYSPKRDKPLIFDANTGAILNYDGQPYKEVKPVTYTDISGHFAEKQITALADNGVSLDGADFKPDSSITQKDFLNLIAKSLHYNSYEIYGTKDEKSEADKLYAYLTREGIIKQNEIAPQALVTREDGVKYIIRALKYDKVADIKGIYNCTFKDKSKINPDLIGYVAIAQGLKIVNGSNGCFNPKNNLTRAEGAIIVYNYMQ